MANWNAFKICEVIDKIESKRLLLPVIQRELVWDEEKIKALFQTLCIGDSYGGIMTVLDEKGKDRDPLFDIRYFEPNYIKENTYESQRIGFSNQNIEYVIDGQQRLSSILMGVRGSYNGKRLFFDLFSDYHNNDYNFEFGKGLESLPTQYEDSLSGEKRQTWWMGVPDIYSRISECPDVQELCDLIVDEWSGDPLEVNRIERVRRNIGRIFAALVTDKSAGICEVRCVLKKKGGSVEEGIAENRLRIVNLFRKLNQGGTVLSGSELMRSVFKALAAENEHFLNIIKDGYSDIGLDQDGIVKYIFLLQDQVAKEITDIKKADSDFITHNKERIFASLNALRKFLERYKLIDYVKKSRPSSIPLYLLAYYLFYCPESNDGLLEYFDKDVATETVLSIKKWMRLSYLNRVFQRGRGWNPDKTGRRLIHEILSASKGKDFPIKEIFGLYSSRLHWFNEEPKDEETRLNEYDRAFVYYSIYDGDVLTRKNDADHIVAQHLLKEAKISLEKINTVSNLQLLYFRENRAKQDQTLADWLNESFHGSEQGINDFLKRHCIPTDKTLWDVDHYDDFLAERRKLIVAKIRSTL